MLVFLTGVGISLIGLHLLEKKGVTINNKAVRVVLVSGLLAFAAYAIMNFPLAYWLR